MIERAGIDPRAAARAERGDAFATAARRCLLCPHAGACRDWLDSRASGPAPDFCGNLAYLRRLCRLPEAPAP